MPHDSPATALPFLHPGSGTGMSLFLVRHAEVAEEFQGRAYGNLDVPLSREGEEDSLRMATALALLGPNRVLASPLQRARTLGSRTADLAGIPLEVEPELAEIDRGNWQGRRVSDLSKEVPEEVAAFYRDPWTFQAHGGECDRDLSARAFRLVDQLLETPCERVVLATHYNVIRVIAAGALGLPAASSFSLRIDPGRCALIVDREDGWHLTFSNLREPRLDRGPVH